MSHDRGRALFEAEPSNHSIGAPQWDHQPEHIKNVFRVRELEAELAATRFKCKYRNSGLGGNDPQDCAWPECGCDPAANKVLDHLTETSLFDRITKLEAELSTARSDLEKTRDELELTRYRESKLEADISEMGMRFHVIETRRNELHEQLEREMLATDIRVGELEAQRDHARGEVATLDYIRSSLATSIEQGKELGNVIARQANLVQTLRGTIAVAREALEWIRTKAMLAHNVNHIEVYSIHRGIADKARAALDQISDPPAGSP